MDDIIIEEVPGEEEEELTPLVPEVLPPGTEIPVKAERPAEVIQGEKEVPWKFLAILFGLYIIYDLFKGE